MSFDDWDEDDLAEVKAGLLLLGWMPDCRLINDDCRWVAKYASEALALERAGQLTEARAHVIANEVYVYMAPSIMSADARATSATGPYSQSPHLRASLRRIDEAALCFKRGYYTAAHAVVLVVLESYLRSLAGWVPGVHLSFRQLVAAATQLPPSDSRDEVIGILNALYGWYDASNPTLFDFNRHGLLHGMRGSTDYDRLNVVRTFLLLDRCCEAEGLTREIALMELYRRRFDLYVDGGPLPAADDPLYAAAGGV